MSQVFQSDAQGVTPALAVVTTAETVAILGNFLSPPFGTCKVKVVGMMSLTIGASTTSVTLRIRRNPQGENVIVLAMTLVTVTAAAVVLLPVMFTDILADGRSVQYEITVQQAAATGNGTINQAYIDATIISG